MIYWSKTFRGLIGSGHYRGWNVEIENKILSRTKFNVKYTLDENSLISAFKFDFQNRSIIVSQLSKVMKGRVFNEFKEIDTFLRWPKTLNDNTVTSEATTHAIAHLNYALDVIPYLKQRGIELE